MRLRRDRLEVVRKGLPSRYLVGLLVSGPFTRCRRVGVSVVCRFSPGSFLSCSSLSQLPGACACRTGRIALFPRSWGRLCRSNRTDSTPCCRRCCIPGSTWNEAAGGLLSGRGGGIQNPNRDWVQTGKHSQFTGSPLHCLQSVRNGPSIQLFLKLTWPTQVSEQTVQFGSLL